MKSKLVAGSAAIVSTLAAIVAMATMLVKSPEVRGQSGGNNQGTTHPGFSRVLRLHLCH